jgi:opacity protein-like surface antigen
MLNSFVVEQSVVRIFIEVGGSVFFVLLRVGFDFGVLVVVVLFFFLFFAVGPSVRLYVNAGFRELRFQQLEQLVGIVAAPFIQNVCQELKKVPCIQPSLDLLDLVLRKGFEYLFAKRFGVSLLDGFLRRESDLADRSPVEVDFHNPVCSAEAPAAFRRMPREASRALTGSRRSVWIVAAGLLAFASLVSVPCAAQELPDLSEPDPSLPPPTPPPISSHYLQYGVAVTGEAVASAGQVCPSTTSNLPCILGDGGGLAVRVGYRSRGPWYLGGAYEFSRQDSANLLRLPILQQLRAELRVHLTRVTRLSPYVGAALGGVIYGNEWGLDTWGAASAVGLGLEFQVTPSIVLNIASHYRQLFLRHWTDGAGQERATGPLDFGLAHIFAVELGFEIREPLSRW